jgi:hypothetical protein
MEYKNSFLDPFTGDFKLPKRICLNGLFWISFDKVRYFLSKLSTLVTSQKKVFFALSDASKWVFEKCCSINFAKNFKQSFFFFFGKNIYF